MAMKHYAFRWVQWNLEHATRHGVSAAECERLVRSGRYRQGKGGKYGQWVGGTVAAGFRWCSR